MASKKHRVTLTSINCKNTSETPHDDEVYIIYQADAGIPVRFPESNSIISMNVSGSGSTTDWYPNLQLDFDHEVLVTLWDRESNLGIISPSFLANSEYRADYFKSPVDMKNHNDAHYVINATKNY